MKPIVKYLGKNLYLECGTYPNGRVGILLNDEQGELWDDLTINLPDKELDDNCVFINPRIENDLLEKLCETGVFLNTYRVEDFDYRMFIINRPLLKEYIEQYKIEIWETEENRDRGEGFIYNKVFDDFDDALEKARNLYDYNNYACVEILNADEESLFCKDEISEEFYLGKDKFSLVSREIVDEYIDNWMDHKHLPTKETKLYCKMALGGYLAIDNSNGECYVEEFDTEKKVHKWLLGKEKDEIEKDIIMEDLEK